MRERRVNAWTGDCSLAPYVRGFEERSAIEHAGKALRAVLNRWEIAYDKENFYRGISILLERSGMVLRIYRRTAAALEHQNGLGVSRSHQTFLREHSRQPTFPGMG